MADYKTVLETCQTESEIKKSKFLTSVFHVEEEESVEDILSDQRKKHYKASHVCWAYVLNTSPKRQKSSDDGEPSGTAGKPILQVINQGALKDVLVVVVRYYGGVKLGAGGLVRAYSGGAVDVLNKAQIIVKKMMDLIHVVIDYSLYGGLTSQLAEHFYSPVNEVFEEQVCLDFQIPLAETADFVTFLEDQTSANFEISYHGQKYVDVKEC